MLVASLKDDGFTGSWHQHPTLLSERHQPRSQLPKQHNQPNQPTYPTLTNLNQPSQSYQGNPSTNQLYQPTAVPRPMPRSLIRSDFDPFGWSDREPAPMLSAVPSWFQRGSIAVPSRFQRLEDVRNGTMKQCYTSMVVRHEKISLNEWCTIP